MAVLNVSANLLGEEGEVLPQLGHTQLQLIALTQQFFFLTNLWRKNTANELYTVLQNLKGAAYSMTENCPFTRMFYIHQFGESIVS